MKPSKPFLATPAQMAEARVQLGLPVGDAGGFTPPSHPEIDLGYSYNGTDTIIITILDEAWYETADEVWNAIGKYLTPKTN